MQHKQSVLFTRPSYRQQESKWSSRGLHPTTFTSWPMRQQQFHSGLRLLRHFEKFLRIRPLQSEASQSTRPWGNLFPLAASPLCAPPFQKMLALKVVHCQHAQSWVFSLTVRPKTQCCPEQDANYFRQSLD